MSNRKHSGSHRSSQADRHRSDASRTSVRDERSAVSGHTSASTDQNSGESVVGQSDTWMYPHPGSAQTQPTDQTWNQTQAMNQTWNQTQFTDQTEYQVTGYNPGPLGQHPGTAIQPAPGYYPNTTPGQHGVPGPIAINYDSYGGFDGYGSYGGSDASAASTYPNPRSSVSPELPQQGFANRDEMSREKSDKPSRKNKHEPPRPEKDKPSKGERDRASKSEKAKPSRREKDKPKDKDLTQDKKKKRDNKEERMAIPQLPWDARPSGFHSVWTGTGEENTTHTQNFLHPGGAPAYYPPPSQYPSKLAEADFHDQAGPVNPLGPVNPIGAVGPVSPVGQVGQASQVGQVAAHFQQHGAPFQYPDIAPPQEDADWDMLDDEDMGQPARGSSSKGRRHRK